MSDAKTDEPDLTAVAETDFSKAIRPNRYAMLRGDFRHAVFIEPQLWEHPQPDRAGSHGSRAVTRFRCAGSRPA